MFRDKVYEELDDISKLIEPYLCEDNEKLCTIPNEITLSFEDIYALTVNNYGINGFGINEILMRYSDETNQQYIKKNEYELSRKFFKIVVDIEAGDEVIVDLEKREVSHEIKLIKQKIYLEEDEIKEKFKRNIERTLYGSLNGSKVLNKRRTNEIAELFNMHDVRKDRSWRGKLHYMKIFFVKSVNNNSIDIRSAILYNNFMNWIVAYIKNGNLVALKNLTKIKVMTHYEKPIYSIEEEQI